jgi:hypothetical protein
MVRLAWRQAFAKSLNAQATASARQERYSHRATGMDIEEGRDNADSSVLRAVKFKS